MDVAQEILNQTPESWVKDEDTYRKCLKNEATWNSIPLLNVADTQYLKEGSLVRFRGMVQDMYDPEYYYEKYEVVNVDTNVRSARNGKYYDTAHWKETENFDTDADNILNERYTFVVISAPGTNSWVKEIEAKQFKPPTSHSNESSQPSTKRSHEEETMDTDQTPSETKKCKKTCNETASSENRPPSLVSTEHILNFPLPGTSGKVCHLKLYDDFKDIKLNELYEFAGFLSTDPILSHESYHNGEFDNPMEVQTHNPPPSLVARVHCVAWKRLVHSNPLVEGVEMSREEMMRLKDKVIVALMQVLLGDNLAAEYLLYHLISAVYIRKDFLAIGKFCVNISNIPSLEGVDVPLELYKFIEMLVPQSYYLPMTLENMNDLSFTPKKDHESNRLTSGILQLNNNTHLVLDETKLKEGKLLESGVKAVGSIADVVKSQTVRYDFGFSVTQEFNSDIPVLIFSEGKSMLPSDFHVPLQVNADSLGTFKEIVEAAKHFLKPELQNIRAFLTLARFGDYDLPSGAEDLIQEEFVSMRRQHSNISGDDLHQLLVLTRLVCLSEGRKLLDVECWGKACQLEATRKGRISRS